MEKAVVSDRVLLLGLDKMYRDDMELHEAEVLLPSARVVAKTLGVVPRGQPIEGYYSESAELAEYFGLIRGLQETHPRRRAEVRHMPEFRRLLQVCSARIFGYRQVDSGLLPVGHDSLSEALQLRTGIWEMTALINEASAVAKAKGDYSLVGLAAWVKDAVCITAARESIVLYAEMVLVSDEILPDRKYEWNVSVELSEGANRFIEEYNGLFSSRLPTAKPENAQDYFEACQGNRVGGRCVRIGSDNSASPVMHYHWKIDESEDGSYAATSFWSHEIWTSERYREELRRERVRRASSQA
jgi:hypothetical protein